MCVPFPPPKKSLLPHPPLLILELIIITKHGWGLSPPGQGENSSPNTRQSYPRRVRYSYQAVASSSLFHPLSPPSLAPGWPLTKKYSVNSKG